MGIIRGNRIIPVAKYCSNCGTKEHHIEQIKNINFFDIYFAIAKKEEEQATSHPELTQTWTEEDETRILEDLRLLPNYLN